MNRYEPEYQGRRLPMESGQGPVIIYQPAPGYGHGGRDGDGEEERLDPLRLLWFIVHYRWLIAAFLLTGLVAGVIATYMQTPLYRATTDIEVVTSGAKVFRDLEVVSQSSDMRAFETAREKLLSRDLARRVVFELNLTESGTFLAPIPAFSLMNVVHRATGAIYQADLDEMTAEERERTAVGKVMANLSAELIPNTSILSASFSHPDPEVAANVANQAAHSYIDQNIDKTSETSDLARRFIGEQVRETKSKLQASEKALVDYAKQAGITVTGDEGSLISENISEINAALSEAVQERIAAAAYYEQAEGGNAASLPGVFESGSIQETKQKIAELKAKYQQKLGLLKPGFPEMQQLQAQIGELQDQVDAEVEAIANAAEIRYRQAQQKVSTLKAELSELEDQQSAYRDKSIRYNILNREVEANRKQYDSLIDKLNEVGVGSELKTTNASIIDPAVAPRSAYSPSLLKIVLMTLALFCAAAAALIYLLELMRNTFTVPDQIESELKLPVLGILPVVDKTDLMTAFGDNRSAISEAYRSLRTSLQFTGTEQAMRTILVTSAEQAEGKSTTSYKLARDFAALGKNVLVIDSDLRKPRLHRIFNTSNAMGLSNLLSNVVLREEVRSIFLETGIGGVTLLPAGTIPPNPVELLMSQRMTMALHKCAKSFDVVIIDGPPVMGLSDAPILSRQADATLMVVSAKQVTRKSAKAALARLKAASGNVVGAALNKFSIDKFDYNYAYRYVHYKYYGYREMQAGIEGHASSGQGKATSMGNLSGIVSRMLGHFRRRAG